MGVVPRDLRNVELFVGSVEVLRGVCIPDGVEPPLILRLVGAGLAEPDAVFLVIVPPVPFVRVVVVFVVVVDVTDKREGRGVVLILAADDIVLLPTEGLRCGMRDGVVSSVLSSDRFEPCLDGGFEPCRLKGRELGFELGREPTGVRPEPRVLV